MQATLLEYILKGAIQYRLDPDLGTMQVLMSKRCSSAKGHMHDRGSIWPVGYRMLSITREVLRRLEIEVHTMAYNVMLSLVQLRTSIQNKRAMSHSLDPYGLVEFEI